ncbi:MAG: tRNA (adenosine(37)-N6)-threonylcarbamoyltransferase complex ATPase subunit type 1 TsaE [Burkholderiaceae bacterium]
MSPTTDDSDQACFFLRDMAATAAMAAALGAVLDPGTRVYLSGDLGAGKTEFCRWLIRSLGYNGRVKSPTFTLMEPYTLSSFTLYHFDFYRFSSEEELREAGFEELIDSDAVVLVEWPERARPTLPVPDLWLRLVAGDEPESRRLETLAGTARGRACLRAMRAAAG